MKKITLFLFLLVSNCFPQLVPRFQHQPPVGYQINLGHPDAQSLIGLWLFNEGLGGKVFDLSPYGRDGSLENMNSRDDWVGDEHGFALDFDGSNDRINVGQIDISGLLELSILVRFRWNEQTGDEQTLTSNFDTPQAGHLFRLEPAGNHLEVFVEATGSLVGGSFTDLTVDSFDDWHIAVFTYNSVDALRCYLDGIESTTNFSADGTLATTASTNEFWFGNTPHSALNDQFRGRIDFVLLFDRTLTATEVQKFQIYQYAMFDQPPGRILAAAVAAAAVERRRLIIAND